MLAQVLLLENADLPGWNIAHNERDVAVVWSTALPNTGNGSTFGFAGQSAAQVDAWHAAGLANGGTTCEDPPGVREGAAGQLYLAYLRDPDGNKICGLYRLPKA